MRPGTATARPPPRRAAPGRRRPSRWPTSGRCRWGRRPRPDPSRSNSRWEKWAGISSTWCVTSTIGGEPGSAASSASRATRRSRPAMSRPAAGSSSSSRSGSAIRVRASSTCWRSPSDRTPKGRSATAAKPARASRSSARARGPRRCRSCHHGSERRVAGAHHHVARRHRRHQHLGHGGADHADALPEAADIDLAQPVAEHRNRAPGRVEVARGQLQHRRLARPVGPEDGPPVAAGDLPGDVAQHRRLRRAPRRPGRRGAPGGGPPVGAGHGLGKRQPRATPMARRGGRWRCPRGAAGRSRRRAPATPPAGRPTSRSDRPR